MAMSSEQVAELLVTMQKQMETMQSVQTENRVLHERNQVLESSRTEHPARRSPPKRPSIEANMDDSDWALFTDSWLRYKKMTQLTEREDINLELRAACSDEVNKLLFEFVGSATLNQTELSEETLLRHIRSVAVKGIHREVHRMNFGKLTQSAGESVTKFAARLKSQSLLCDFNVECTCHQKVSFAEEMVSQKLLAGIRNQEHQSRILGEATTLTTLQQKIDRLISLETTEEASSTIRDAGDKPTGAAAGKSMYKRITTKMPRKPIKPANKQPHRIKPCRGCGKTSHGPEKTMSRRDCPQYNHKCDTCGFMGHHASVCERSKSRSAQSKEDQYRSDSSSEDERFPERSRATSSSFAFATNFRISPEPNEQE